MAMFGKHLPRILFGLLCLVAFLGHAGKYWQLPFVVSLDAYLYDVRLRLFMPGTLDDRLVIVDIDEKSLAEVGRWPWNREQMATIIQRLTDEYKVAVVGMDVVFAEPDESSGLKVLEQLGSSRLQRDTGYQAALKDLRQTLDYDKRFATSLHGRPVVMGFYFSNEADAQRSGALPQPTFPRGAFQQYPEQIIGWKGFGANLPELQQAAATGGHFNSFADFDGITRRVALLSEHDGNYYETLSVAMLRVLFGQATLSPGYPDNFSPMEWLDLVTPQGTLRIPVDADTAALVPFRGSEKSYPYVSAADVLKGRVDPGRMLGRIVLFGTTAPGLKDLRATPVGGSYPGVEIHANLITGMLDGTIKEQPNYVVGAELLNLLLVGGTLAILLPLLSPLRGTLLTIMVLSGSLALNASLWNAANIVLPLASTGLAALLIYGFNMAYGFFVEARVKRQLTELFGQYVPPELVDEMAKSPDNYSMEGRNAELSVLFSDVRSFTTISEGMEPQELTRLMNEYMGAMTAIVRRYRGTLDKYIGDAIMAFWGAPVNDPQHAQHAVESALAMQEEMKHLAEQFQARGWPVLKIGIGINTGTMTVGDMGSVVRKSYTVMGDAVNLGSRLEGITKEYGVGIIVGELTRRQTQGIAFRELDRVRVKGKNEPVAIYEPVGHESALPVRTREELQSWQHTLDMYRDQHWDAAEAQLQKLVRTQPDCHLYPLYLERIEHLRAHPPGTGWDGVTAFKTK